MRALAISWSKARAAVVLPSKGTWSCSHAPTKSENWHSSNLPAMHGSHQQANRRTIRSPVAPLTAGRTWWSSRVPMSHRSELAPTNMRRSTSATSLCSTTRTNRSRTTLARSAVKAYSCLVSVTILAKSATDEMVKPIRSIFRRWLLKTPPAPSCTHLKRPVPPYIHSKPSQPNLTLATEMLTKGVLDLNCAAQPSEANTTCESWSRKRVRGAPPQT
mmetsp:Transcript_18944/g.58927  ORF Transcript_18944/g.58927 Transcript_18944/m.58927 type:complete len:217 (+) Transcript_18944:530-1180(+)